MGLPKGQHDGIINEICQKSLVPTLALQLWALHRLCDMLLLVVLGDFRS